MNEETKIEDNEIYSYKDSDGKLYYTPNQEFASARAYKYGTEKVYVEKY